MKPPVIEHGRYTLRLPEPVDLPWIFQACQDPDIQRFTTVPSPYGADDAVGWIRFAADECAADRAYHFLIGLTETGELLGSCGIGCDEEPSQAELGYWVDPNQRGQGVASAAVTAVEGWAARALGIVEVALRIAEPNVASMRVAERCGYRLVGPDDNACKGLPTLRFTKTLI